MGLIETSPNLLDPSWTISTNNYIFNEDQSNVPNHTCWKNNMGMWVKRGSTNDLQRGGATHLPVILKPLLKLLKMEPLKSAFTFDLQVQINSGMLKTTQVSVTTAAVCFFAQTYNHMWGVKLLKKSLQCLSNYHHHYHHHAWCSELYSHNRRMVKQRGH